jgi:hypothetical protein
MPHGEQTRKSGTKAHAARVKGSRKTAKGKRVEAKGEEVTEEFLVGETEDHKKTAEEKQFTLAQVTSAPGGGQFKVKFSESGADVKAIILSGARLRGKKVQNSNAATRVGDFVIALWSKDAENATVKDGTEIKGKVPKHYITDAKRRARQLGYSWPKKQSDELFEKVYSSNNSASSKSSSSSRSTTRKNKKPSNSL